MHNIPTLKHLCVAMLALSPMIALPQDESATDAGATELPVIPLPQADAPKSELTQSAEPTSLPTVVVTGELLTREADQTTSSVAVHTGAEIERSTARDVYDVIRATPNAALEDSDYGYGGMSLRGIGSYGASGSGAYASYGTTSVVVLDGVGLPRSALSYADLSAFDLDTVEIFRGPQSTSQGRNAMAGAVVINSVAPEPMPEFDPQLRGRVAGGDYSTHQYAAAAEATLWPDALALRVTHDDRSDDGDVRNATRADDDTARRDSRSTRLRARLRPGGDGGRYEVLLSAADIERYRGSSYVLLAHEHDRTALNDQPTDFDNRSRLYAIDQRLRLGGHWQLRAVSAWFRSETFSRFDTDYTADDGGATLQWEDSDGFSQEVRATFDGEHLRGSFGLYYADENNRDDSAGYLDLPAFYGLCEIEIICSMPLGRVEYQGANPSEVTDVAVFGEVDWRITERLALIAGLRADREENSRIITTRYDGNSPTSALLVALLAGSVLPADGSIPVEREFSEVLPKFALRYELFDGWFAGASYAEGYRPGGDGYNQVSGRYFSFDAERTRNTELSFKGSHTPWRLQAALNLFHTRWDDMQVQGGEGMDNYMENAGRATIRGGELELRWRPVPALQVVGGFGVTHGRFDQYVSTEGEDFAGNRLPKAPTHSGTLALEWSPLSGLLIRPDILWVGATPANADNNPVHELPAYPLVNLALRWQLEHFSLFFTGSNLTDEHYRNDANNYGSTGYDVVSLGARRRLSGGLAFEF
jgi:iron complex outermembrane receptor protein